MLSSSTAFAAGGIDVVLGCTGTIGALLVQRLATTGRKVKSISRSGTIASNVHDLENVEGVRASVLSVTQSKRAPPHHVHLSTCPASWLCSHAGRRAAHTHTVTAVCAEAERVFCCVGVDYTKWLDEWPLIIGGGLAGCR